MQFASREHGGIAHRANPSFCGGGGGVGGAGTGGAVGGAGTGGGRGGGDEDDDARGDVGTTGAAREEGS